MELFIQGKGSVRLDQSDFVGQGGEGKVYARGTVAYKVYTDPARMIPIAKIRELSALTHSDIIRPDEVLLDAQNRPVGYTMRRVQDAHPLCRLFTRAFRERKGVTASQMLALVREFQQTVEHIHDQGVLIVDMNEMNFLVDRDLLRVLFIDVDSYKTPGFPATAIMDSIRDRHRPDFSVETDWFSFAIVTFQMFVGIHPYRGKHATLADIDARMQANVSVLNPAVTMPASCYPLDSLPPVYRDWYEAVFERGIRTPPPIGARCAAAVTPRILHLPASVRLKIREVARFTNNQQFTASHQPARTNNQQPITNNQLPITNNQQPAALLQVIDTMTAMTAEGVYIRGTLRFGWDFFNLRSSSKSAEKALVVTPRLRTLVAAILDDGILRLWELTNGKELPCCLHAEGLLSSAGRIYIKQKTLIYELRWLEQPATLQPMLHPVGNVLPQATRLFDGAAVQDMLGACYVSVFPEAGVCRTVRLPELDGARILDGRYEQNVLMLASDRAGSGTISIVRFGDSYQGYDLRAIPDVSSPDLNFVTLDNGICLWLNPQEELEIFSNRKGSTSLKRLDEPALQGARLFHDGTQALFARADALFEMTMGT
jgi:serine/threonine protein kinase